MSILMVTSLSSYAKNIAMKVKWQKKQEEGDYTPDHNDSDSVDKAFQKQLDEFLYPEYDRSCRTEGEIDIKLIAGKKLNDVEMQYLKTHAPATYQKAKIIEREREAYEKALASCKTKDEVEQLKADRAETAVNRMRAIKNNSAISAAKKRELFQMEHFRAAALDDAMHEFTDSPDYEDLPSGTNLLADETDMEETRNAGLEPDSEFFQDRKVMLDKAAEEAAEYKMPAEETDGEKSSPVLGKATDDACEEGTIMRAILDEEARWAREGEENISDSQKTDLTQEEKTLEIFNTGQAKAAYLACQDYRTGTEAPKIDVRR